MPLNRNVNRAPVAKLIVKSIAGGTLESGKFHYCNVLPTNHYCVATIAGLNVYIEGIDDPVCGKKSCFLCREKWGNAENFANTCKDHAMV